MDMVLFLQANICRFLSNLIRLMLKNTMIGLFLARRRVLGIIQAITIKGCGLVCILFHFLERFKKQLSEYFLQNNYLEYLYFHLRQGVVIIFEVLKELFIKEWYYYGIFELIKWAFLMSFFLMFELFSNNFLNEQLKWKFFQ